MNEKPTMPRPAPHDGLVPIPCPDGLPGCLVAHYGPAAPNLPDSETRESVEGILKLARTWWVDTCTNYDQNEAALRAAVERVIQERDEAQRMVKNLAPIGRYNGLDIEQWKERAERAEQEAKREGELREKTADDLARVIQRAERAEAEAAALRELLGEARERLAISPIPFADEERAWQLVARIDAALKP